MTLSMSSKSTMVYRMKRSSYRYSENIIPFISEQRYGRLSALVAQHVWIAAIRRLMASKGLNQQALAKAARMRPNTLSDALSGKTDPQISTFTQIAAGLDVPMWALFTNESEYGVVKTHIEKTAAESVDARQERQVRSIVESNLPLLVEALTATLTRGIHDGTLQQPEPQKPQGVPAPVKKVAGRKAGR